jgi:hypothetical protein
MRIITKNLAESRERLLVALRERGAKAIPAHGEHKVWGWTTYGAFALSFLPGNRRTLVSHEVEVFLRLRSRGYGTKMCALRESAAQEAGVTLMLATVMDDNLAEIRVLEKRKWSRLTQNKETKCSLWGKSL